MKKNLIKITAVLLCMLVCLSSFAPVLAVSLPQGVTSEELLDAIPRAELLVKSLLLQGEKGKSLESVVYGMLFDDKTVNSVFTGIYSALTENEAAMKTLGIDISLEGVAGRLGNYPEVSKYLLSCDSWEKALKKMNCKWGIKSKDGLKNALAAMFSPFQNLLYTLLCGGRYKVNSLVYVDGDLGYQNAIVPLLKALGCPSILSQETFTAHAKAKASSQVKDIADMLFAVIDSVIESPVDRLCTILPGFALYMKNGGIGAAMESLISPLKVRVGIISIPGLDKLISKSGAFSDSSALTAMFENIDLSEVTGSDIKLKMPEINLDALASCCTFANDVYVTDKAAAMCEILRWAVSLIKLNKDALLSSAGEIPAEISSYIDGIFSKSDDELVKLVLGFLTVSTESSVLEYQWEYPEYVPGAIVYTPNLTQAEFQKVLMDVDDTLNQFTTEFSDGALSDTLSKLIYSGKLVTMLAKTLYGALHSEQTAQITELIGLDASPQGIAQVLKNSYPSASSKIASLKSWDELKEDAVSWGFYDGSRSGFENAVVTLLRPLIPFLDMLLAQGEITLFGAIPISGSNGYNTAVIPILDALGCGDIKTYAQYKEGASTDNAVRYILTPICDMLDTLIQKPLRTLCLNLPNLLYFVNSGGIKQCMDNLLYPITSLLQKLGMTELLPAELTSLGDFDLGKIMEELSAGGTLPIKLPQPDFVAIASLGQAEQMDSKRTYNGLFTPVTYIRADAPAVFVTLLRYLFDAVALPENAGVLSSIVPGGSSEDGNTDMFAMYAGDITEKLKAMSTDEIIEWLYDLLFKETPKKELTEENEEIPTIIYQPKKDYTVLLRTLLIIAAIGIPVLIVIYVSKTDFNEKKERRERKKQKKQKAKADKKAYGASPSQKPVVKPHPTKKAAEQSGEKENLSVRIQQVEGIQPKSIHEKAQKDRELLKLKARSDKAVKKAMKDAKKADKYFEQAIKESKKRK